MEEDLCAIAVRTTRAMTQYGSSQRTIIVSVDEVHGFIMHRSSHNEYFARAVKKQVGGQKVGSEQETSGRT